MGRFISVPGLRHGKSGGETGAAMLPSGYRGPLPNPHDSPHLAEFFANRAPTSHTMTGLDAQDRVQYRGDAARVEGEERDQHTGKIDQFIQVSDSTGSGTRKVTWEPDGPRGMRVTNVKKVFE